MSLILNLGTKRHPPMTWKYQKTRLLYELLGEGDSLMLAECFGDRYWRP